MKKLLTALLLLASLPAFAQQACPPTGTIAVDAALVCWTNATQDINGNALPATGPFALTQTRIQRAQVLATATCSFTTIAQTLNVTPDVKVVLFEALPVGKQCFRARHASLDAGGLELLSDWSATVSKLTTSPTPPPAKAKPLTITIY
jgi:hypothetical protein